MITDFLKTKTTPEDLAAALRVLKEFKQSESLQEWLQIPFSTWTKLEQLEEFLEHLVNKQPLRPDTLKQLARVTIAENNPTQERDHRQEK